MGANIFDWLLIILRIFHLVAGIYWIGSSFYFMWLDGALDPPKEGEDPRITGELWMVHSGGFYHVRKKKFAPNQVPERLHWFKWEAGLTWLSGISLLSLIFYSSGGISLLDAQVSSISFGAATALSISVLVVGWHVYDTLFASPLGLRHPGLCAILGLMALVGVVLLLTHTLSGRAAYIHTGALLGTIMVGNVWIRIIPYQQRMVQAAARGEEPDHELGELAKRRSIHNNYTTFPVLFIMLSNHFHQTYGHPHNAWILLGVMLVGAGVRHYLNTDRPRVLLPVSVLLALLIYLTGPEQPRLADEPIEPPPPANMAPPPSIAPPAPIAAPTPTGTQGTMPLRLRGLVRYTGAVPPPQPLALSGECGFHKGPPPLSNTIRAQDGKLQDVVVYVKFGLSRATAASDQAPAILDQQGCMFVPRILAIQAGRSVTFQNSDPVFHNVKCIAVLNPGFNTGVEIGGKFNRVFARAEFTKVQCSVHPWMLAHIAVLPNASFTLTGADGSFDLGELPAGPYTVATWHESLGAQDLKINLDGQPLEFIYKN